MLVSNATKLRQIRDELTPRVSQEAMCRRAGVSLQTYRKVEEGGRCYFHTAEKIVTALNEFLQERGQNTVTLDELGLQLY